MQKFIIQVFLISAFLAAPAYAAENGSSFGDIFMSKALDRVTEKKFSADEKALLKEFLSTPQNQESGTHRKKQKKHKGLPPGLAKKDHLPPGLQKQLERNGHLPPGLEKRDLPADLTSKLPSCNKKKTGCAIVGDDVVLIEKGTDLILDIIEKALIKP